MAEQKVIGGPLSTDVLAQLDIRSKVMSKDPRTSEDIMLLNANIGWAKMSSGVDVNGSNALAKSYVLVAGQAGKQGTETYSTYLASTGFRPMPGITGVDVHSLNRFGVLKEATVTFNCWSVEQLTDLEMLYMRPGYTALLEWGHSIYTKDGKAPYDKHVETIQNFFNEKGLTRDIIHKEIEVLKKQSAYNYDGIYGFIKNFSWSFRQDGGYDCTTTIISMGELVESLQVLLDATSHDTPGVATKINPDEKSQATILQGVLTYIKNGSQAEASNVWTQISAKYPNFATRFMTANGSLGLDGFGYLGASSSDVITVTSGNSNEKHTTAFGYITFKSFCQIINALTLVDQAGELLTKFNTDKRPENDANSSIPSSKFKTFKFHESIDPSVCLIVPITNSVLYASNKTAYTQLKNIIGDGASEEILNILLNVDMLLAILDDIIKRPAEERSLFSIFTSIFAQVNKALGEINEIALHYDETTSIYYIVDRQVKVDNSDLQIINITGLKSTVTKFDFTTKLAPALSTMIAISAQAGNTDIGVDASALMRWNEGLTDRIVSTKGIEKKPDDTETAQAKIELQQNARENIYRGFLQKVYKSKQFDEQSLDEAQRNYSQYAQTYMNSFDNESSGKSGPAGIVPFEVGIDMNGISGIKIGQAFRINEKIMPNKYNGVIGFIVTGISHRIANNKWTTILKAQTIILAGGLKKPIAKDRKSTVLPGIQSASNNEVAASETIKNLYKPTLKQQVPGAKKGIALLITAQSQFEGFFPGSKSYRTNNPGNIGNVDNGATHTFSTLATGIQAQYDYATAVALNRDPKHYYVVGKTKVPGTGQIYQGHLDQYLKIYSTGARTDNNYLNFIIGFFKKEGITITPQTTIRDIYNLN